MLICRNYDEILLEYLPKTNLTKSVLDKFPIDIAKAMFLLAGNEISCDCRFEKDDGCFLYSDRVDANLYTLITTSGQGDEWLLRIDDNMICFLDHDIWEEPNAIISIDIEFKQFVIMADLLKQYESINIPDARDIELLKQNMHYINIRLPDIFPFDFS